MARLCDRDEWSEEQASVHSAGPVEQGCWGRRSVAGGVRGVSEGSVCEEVALRSRGRDPRRRYLGLSSLAEL